MNFGPILIAEDDASDAIFLLRALKLLGIANPIRVLTDGRQAIRYLSGDGPYSDRQLNPMPEVLFLDLRMPTPGTEVLTWMRSDGSGLQIPTLVMTDRMNVQEIRMAYNAGATSFLMKPITDEDLRNVFTGARGLSLQTTESGLYICGKSERASVHLRIVA